MKLRAVAAIWMCVSLPLALASGGCKKVGEVKTIDVAGDANGEPSHPASVRIELGAGDLHITPGGGHVVGGSVRTNVSDLEPKVDAAGDHVTVTQGMPAAAKDTKYGNELVADWRLTLGPTPMALVVETGAGSAELDLGGLAIKALRVHSGSGAVKLGFSGPNPLAADSIDIETGAGAITITDLARFGATTVRVHSGVGAVSVALGSTVDRDIVLDLEASAGALTVKLPATITARATMQTGVGKVTADGWTKDGADYVLGVPGPTPRVTVRARTGVGGITLQTGI
jgi:N-terminal domain of toast_rack, DUF2154